MEKRDVHTIGAERHGSSWFNANLLRAVEILWTTRLRADSPDEQRPCWNKGWANLAAPAASQAPAPKRPDGRHFIRQESFNDACQFYMDYLEGRVRSAKEIIEQYPPMVRNILGGKAVRNVSELEASAKSWLEKYHE